MAATPKSSADVIILKIETSNNTLIEDARYVFYGLSFGIENLFYIVFFVGNYDILSDILEQYSS
jgi:hypothetical protein